MLDAAYTAWRKDLVSGRHTPLIAGTGEEVAALNQRARLDRVAAARRMLAVVYYVLRDGQARSLSARDTGGAAARP